MLLVQLELCPNRRGVAAVEAVCGELLLFHQTNVTVGFVGRPSHVIDAVDILQERADAFEAIREFDGNWIQIQPATLLEVRELRNLKSIEKDLPADSPRTERGRLPVVFFEANIVLFEFDSDGSEALQIKILDVNRRWFKYYLKLEVLIESLR